MLAYSQFIFYIYFISILYLFCSHLLYFSPKYFTSRIPNYVLDNLSWRLHFVLKLDWKYWKIALSKFVLFCFSYLQDNRITRIESGAFQDVRANTLNFYNNKLRVIESNAFTTVHADTFSFTGNLVREIQSHAFNGTSCSYFYMQNMNLGVIPSYAFTDFTCGRVDLQSSSITDIKKHAFYNFRVNYNL